MPLNFEKHAQKGNKFVKDVATALGDKSDTAKAGRMVVAVLHTLRSHLTAEENLKFLSQLPMALKGVYVHRWASGRRNTASRQKIDFMVL